MTEPYVIREYTGSFSVWLDDDNDVEWNVEDANLLKDEDWQRFGDIQAKMISLHVSEPADKACLRSIRLMLGEAVALGLESRFQAANAILDDARNALSIPQRIAYAQGGFLSCISFCVVDVLLLIRYSFNQTEFSQYLLLCLGGGLGALLSIGWKWNLLPYVPSNSLNLFRVDGALRIVIGMIAAAFVGSAVLSGIVFNNLFSDPKGITTILFVGMLAGMSETLVPSLLSSFEKAAEPRTGNRPEALTGTTTNEPLPPPRTAPAGVGVNVPQPTLKSKNVDQSSQ